MRILNFFNDKGAQGKLKSFYSDSVLDRYRKDKIRSIAIPAEIQSFTTGAMPFMTDGSHPKTLVRYDACRNQETGRWEIRQFLDVNLDEGAEVSLLKNGQQDDVYIGSPACDFDVIRYLSEETAARDHLIKPAALPFSSPYKGHRDMPHWRTVAEKAKQPVDKAGCVQPVVAGQVLADHVTFDDPKQIKIRDSSRPPALTPKKKFYAPLVALFNKETPQEMPRPHDDKIRNIKIPADTQAFTTGEMPCDEEEAPFLTLRYDAHRDRETGFWEIHLHRKICFGGRMENPEIWQSKALGTAPSDYDALRFLSEQSAERLALTKKKAPFFSRLYKGYDGAPNWHDVAKKAGQHVDESGRLQPVVEGQILPDTPALFKPYPPRPPITEDEIRKMNNEPSLLEEIVVTIIDLASLTTHFRRGQSSSSSSSDSNLFFGRRSSGNESSGLLEKCLRDYDNYSP